MVFFNYTTMEMSAKIVYYGAGLCGKTTNLQYIYDHLPRERRGEMVSLPTETDRTLFFDLLPLRLGKVGGFTTRLQLYTVPGQVFYNSTRKLVLKGLDAVVFVADSQAPMLDANIESLENLQENLRDLKLDLRSLPWVIQYNKRDLANILPMDELEKHLNFMGVPAYESIATTGEGVIESLKGISKLTLQHLKQKAGYEAAPEVTPKQDEILIGATGERNQPEVAMPPPMESHPAPLDMERAKEDVLQMEEVEISDSLELEADLLEVEDLPEELELQTEDRPVPTPESVLEDAPSDLPEFGEEDDELVVDLSPGAAPPEPAHDVVLSVPPVAKLEVPALDGATDAEPLTVVKTIRVPVRISRDAALRGVKIELHLQVDCTVHEGLPGRRRERDSARPAEDSRVTRALQDLRRLGSADSQSRRRRSR